ncbi:hypothetical protein KHQ89_01780 [Mycoplasmatota bacterium]|nr:hypothetical protein KHQ89_01780 [Mycoplasmatota bacterium]
MGKEKIDTDTLNEIEKKRLKQIVIKTQIFVSITTLTSILMILVTLSLQLEKLTLKFYIAVLVAWVIIILIMIWQFIKIRREANGFLNDLSKHK